MGTDSNNERVQKIPKAQGIVIQDSKGKMLDYIGLPSCARAIINSSLHSEDEFLALPAEGQITMCFYTMFQIKLQRIKAQIDYELDPQNLGKKFL